ncbi:inner membrane protein yiaB [Escherichia coli 5-366-08_S4_C2]|nr:Inner membrane protein YiaB [Escherichia coli]EMV36813.1 inner membrane protein yiaB [Escherichia coli BCE019_MS-13]EMX21353.1 inner membrane protein yiaB [Escherichia coli MP021566.1]EMZ63412.1 inner membrane protein yiaB [Escherichia coli 2846750]EMZ76435.1 inner membrane protein yiaB [Escherichia coli 2722950]ENA27925.1 inner membrane protein yiaB [Escherichia coli BCE007_MS-11]ENA48988.1 inner membrane protein yiaB [Escherichia coli 2726950]ENA74823.1 inner membrane protein yiaB [Esch
MHIFAQKNSGNWMIFFTHICQLVALITIGLLFIGVLNAPINTYEMVIYPIAFFVCLFGQMRLFRSA